LGQAHHQVRPQLLLYFWAHLADRLPCDGSTWKPFLDELVQDFHHRVVHSLQQAFRPDTIKTIEGLGYRKDAIMLPMLVGLVQATALVNLIWLRSQMLFERVKQKTST
jgi:hypothetical protein